MVCAALWVLGRWLDFVFCWWACMPLVSECFLGCFPGVWGWVFGCFWVFSGGLGFPGIWCGFGCVVWAGFGWVVLVVLTPSFVVFCLGIMVVVVGASGMWFAGGLI